MKKNILIFLITTLATTTSFSQTISRETENDSTVLITSNQLKNTNLIFIEHEKLLKENALLYKQLDNYKVSNDLLVQTDSLRKKEIAEYKLLTESFNAEIKKLNKEIKRKDKRLLSWKIGGITISSGLLLWLLLK